MFPVAWQLVDFRGRVLSAFAMNQQHCSAIGTVSLSECVPGQQDWLERVMSEVPALGLSSNSPVIALIPNRLLLFKIFKIAATEGGRIRALLEIEVEQGFPHEKSELIWCYQKLSGDDIEHQYLVAAIRQNLLRRIADGFESNATPLFGLIPSFLFAFGRHSNIDATLISDGGLSHLLSIENDYCVAMTRGNTGGFIRTFSVRDELGCREENTLKRLQSELKKTMAAVRRQLGRGSRCGVTVFRHTTDVSAAFPIVAESYGLDLLDDIVSLSNAFDGELSDFSELQEGVILSLPSPEMERSTPGNRMLLAGVLMLAISPYLWVWGNSRVIASYQSSLHTLGRLASHKEQTTAEFERLSRHLMSKIDTLEEQHLEAAQREALLVLFSELQESMIAVGDTWFDKMHLDFQSGSPENGDLQLEGRFLVRQSNLRDEFRQQAIFDAEKSLEKLQAQLLESSYIRRIRQFVVNYGGIDQGLNVVSFSLALDLGIPFATAESGSEGVP